ncbi:thiamine pyrophosphate-dependent enzyme [Streptomyces sp. INA 01156]
MTSSPTPGPDPAAHTAARPAPAGTVPGGDAEVLRGYYRQMALIRAFELRAAEMYTRAKIGGYCHLNLGEEATCVGLMAALRPTDYLFTTYREHGYALARGADPGRVMAELSAAPPVCPAGAAAPCTCSTPGCGCWAATESSAASCPGHRRGTGDRLPRAALS